LLAYFDSECENCGDSIIEGDEIVNMEGEWICAACNEEWQTELQEVFGFEE